jgi:hypothetical protein
MICCLAEREKSFAASNEYLGEDDNLKLTLSQWIFCETQRFEIGTPFI